MENTAESAILDPETTEYVRFAGAPGVIFKLVGPTNLPEEVDPNDVRYTIVRPDQPGAKIGNIERSRLTIVAVPELPPEASGVWFDILDVPTKAVLQFFDYAHLPADKQAISREFYILAYKMVANLPMNPERTVMLRKLKEAKDAAVCSSIDRVFPR